MTDYGTLILVYLAEQDGRLCSASDVAAGTHVAAPTAQKLLKVLAHTSLVNSVRGAEGGYRLARLPADISAAQILDVLEGPIAITECSTEESHCELETLCHVSAAWQKINQALRTAMADVSLADLAQPTTEFPPLNLSKPAEQPRG